MKEIIETTRANSTTRTLYLIVLIAVFGGLTFMLFAPFVNILVISFILVELFYPLYRVISKYIKNNGIAAVISTLISFAVVVIPLTIIILITAGEAVNFTRQAQAYLVTNNVISTLPQQLIGSANSVLANLNVPAQYRFMPIDFSAVISEIGSGFAATAGSVAGALLAGGIGLLFQIFLLIVSMIFIFELRGNLRQTISSLSPLDDDLDRLFFDKFISTTRAVAKGSVIVAFIQATSVIVVMILMGAPSPVLLWLIMLLASLVPVGSGIVWFPAGVILILSGQPVAGIFLIIYSAIIINVIDTGIRPLVMKNSTQLHPLVTLFSVLGGIAMFGIIGVLYGPIITVLFISLLHVYNSSKRAIISEQTELIPLAS